MAKKKLHEKKLGEILKEYGLVTDDQLRKALLYQKKEGLLIGEALVKLGYIEHEDIIVALSEQDYALDNIKEYITTLCKRLFPTYPINKK